MANQAKFLKFWFPVILYSGIIFYTSSLANIEIPGRILFSDKLAHGAEYAILSILLSRALTGTTQLTQHHILVASVVFCLLYGLSDEYHQFFVPGRTSCLSDAVADGIGGLIGGFIYARHDRRKN